MKMSRSVAWVLIAAAVVAVPLAAAQKPASLAEASARGSVVDWTVLAAHQKAVLTVSVPDGSVVRSEFAAGTAPTFSAFGADGATRPEGVYNWELRLEPVVPADVQRKLAGARARGDEAAAQRIQRANGLDRTLVQAGSFSLRDGSFVADDLVEPRSPAAASKLGSVTAADQVIPDDLIVQGSECVGLDCVNNENFGFDTIRLKENNLRIHFDDTSTQAGFPANDWRLIANDSASGGSSKFSIEDSTSAKTPFTITAGAATNSIFVDSTGRVGLRTSTPVLDLHINTSNTPAIRLEQNNSGGFTAQTWDIGANEANFFVRDVTGGSRLPFRIRPGAPTSSIDISADGDVGIGTASPTAKVHVASTGSGATDGKLLVANTSGTNSGREMIEAINNGTSLIVLNNSNTAGNRWAFGSAAGGTFLWDNQADAATEMSLDTAGNLTTTGTVNGVSSRTAKMDFVALDPKAMLSRLATVPISMWSYKADGPGVRHVGPIAEDFYQAFGLGQDDKHISFTDSAGVALAAVQGLNEVVQEKDQEISDLKSRLAQLEKIVQALAQGRQVTGPEAQK